MADPDGDDLGYTLDAESIIRIRKACDIVEALPINQVGFIGAMPTDPRNPPAVQFYNDSGSTASAGAIMRVTGLTDSAAEGGGTAGDGSPILKVGQPDTTFGVYVVNALADVEAGDYGTCYDCGDVLFLYDSGTPTRGDEYGPKPSQFSASFGMPGLIRVYGVLDSTNKIAYGRLNPIVSVIGKLDGTLSQGSHQTVSIWAGTANSEADTTMNVEGYDWLMKSGATAIASGKKVKLDLINGTWYVTNAECA